MPSLGSRLPSPILGKYGLSMSKSYLCTPALRILSRSDLADITLPPSEVIARVEDAYLAYAQQLSRCPTKLMMPIPRTESDAVAYSMLGYDGTLQQVGFKTSYRQGNDSAEKYYTTLTLYDDARGLPFALMDGHRIGSLRTPATSAIIAKHCAHSKARSVLMVGTGAQGLHTLPYIIDVLPQLEETCFFGTHPDGIKAMHDTFSYYCPDRTLQQVDDLKAAIAEADIVIAASGRAAHPKIQTAWMKPGGLLISVSSKGVEAGALRQADYVVATNTQQMGVTGHRLAQGPNGEPGEAKVNAELPEIVAGKAAGRTSDDQRIFAFSSGMVITDIPVGHALANRAIAAGRGERITLWQ
ncbi:Alanine dehydrogenase [Carnimonas sp. LMG 33810]